jgi:L-ascorbate metabolism protein UlaG (beta-lactamase superfamily)
MDTVFQHTAVAGSADRVGAAGGSAGGVSSSGIPQGRIVGTALRRLVRAARSGLRRYPRALYESVRQPYCPVNCPATVTMPDLSSHDLAAVWLGHATVLVRVGGVSILMDPVLSERIGMSVGPITFGLPRLAPTPFHPEHLGPVDLILVSHAHFDHLDKPTLKRLVSPATTVVTARRTAKLIPPGFGNVIELDWDQKLNFRGVELSSLRPVHWGARTALDRRRGYNSYLLRSDDHGVLLAGDTAFTDAFNHLTDLTLAVMGIGAYEPWQHAHATPEQVWEMFKATEARHLLPVHHSTFPLGDEHIDEPMQRLLATAGAEAQRVVIANPGQVWTMRGAESAAA